MSRTVREYAQLCKLVDVCVCVCVCGNMSLNDGELLVVCVVSELCVCMGEMKSGMRAKVDGESLSAEDVN